MSKRLEVLKESLKNKERLFAAKLSEHYASVKQANGQPLNDKRNGAAALGKWERQNAALRRVQEGIEKTQSAIEREESAIARVTDLSLPGFIQSAIEAGELTQWRKHPNRFFVPGVDRGRIVWDTEKKVLMHSHLSDVPKDQYPKFRDAFNKLRRESPGSLDKDAK